MIPKKSYVQKQEKNKYSYENDNDMKTDGPKKKLKTK